MGQNLKLSILIMLVFCCFSNIVYAERIEINLPAYTLKVFRENHLLEEFPIAIGRPDKQTPTGIYHLVNKVANPTWYKPGGQGILPPGPNNPLGSHWMGLDLAGYGLHGTIDPDSIGKAVTQGCIRLNNDDIARLYGLVPLGTSVEIIYEPLELAVEGWDFSLKLCPDIYEKGGNAEELIVHTLRKTYANDSLVFKTLLADVIRDSKDYRVHLPILFSLGKNEPFLGTGMGLLNSKPVSFNSKQQEAIFSGAALQAWYETEQEKLRSLFSPLLLKGREQRLWLREN